MTPTAVRSLSLVAPLFAALSLGCLQTPVASLDEVRHDEGLAEDEQHLWKKARETEVVLDGSGMRIDDAELEAYLAEVVDRLAGEQLAAAGIEPRVAVLSNPDMNAFAFPDGVVYVHTALLARMENEAQLATMLSREYAHVLYRHALMKHRSDRATGNMLAATKLLATGVQGGSYAQMFLQASSFSSMGGYHHVLEMRSDRLGLEMMDAAGYDLNEAPRLFEMTMEYLAEVQAQRPPGPLPFAFSTTAHVQNRVAAYRKLLSTDFAEAVADPSRARNAPRFHQMVHGVRVHQAGLELDRGRFDSAARTAEMALETRPDDAAAWVIVGEARLRSRANADRPGAIAAWERALEVDANHPAANRRLGLLYYRDFERGGEHADAARSYLARYLRVAPDAPDAGHVQHYLERLDARAGVSR